MSLWNTLPIEKKLKEKLVFELGEHRGEERFAYYTTARQYLLEEVLEEIKAQQPSLSDHGPSHIADVLEKAYELLGDGIEDMSATDLYVLCISILFHDVGNFHGRKKHNIKIAEFYDDVRKKLTKFDTERAAVLAVAGAHTGFCKEGTKNTLEPLRSTGVFGTPADFQQIAALLRFADELAEGPQRTSLVMQQFKKYSADSTIFHKLANVTNYTVNNSSNRIQVDYSIRVESNDLGELFYDGVPLIELLEKLTDRVSKLNDERVYCRYFCKWLEPYKEVSVDFKFIYQHEYLELGLEPLVLNDLVVPGDNDQNVCEPDYSACKLHGRVEKAVKEKGE